METRLGLQRLRTATATRYIVVFAFIKVGVESVGPMTLTSARLGIAMVLLYLAWFRGYRLPDGDLG